MQPREDSWYATMALGARLTSSIPAGWTATHTTPVAHPNQHLIGVLHNLPARNTLERGTEANTAVFGLARCIVHSLWQLRRVLFLHAQG